MMVVCQLLTVCAGAVAMGDGEEDAADRPKKDKV
jgi:hypothetical protein